MENSKETSLSEALLRVAEGAVSLLDKDLNCLWLSSQFSKVLGVNEETAVGKSLESLLTTALDGPTAAEVFKKVLALSGAGKSELISGIPAPMRKNLGGKLDLHLLPLTRENLGDRSSLSREAALLITFQNSTDESLQKLSGDEWLNTILQQLPCGVIVAEFPTGKFLIRNEYVTKLSGQTYRAPNGLVEYRQYEVTQPDGKAYGREDWPMARVFRSRESILAEHLVVKLPDGRQRHLSVDSAPVMDRGGNLTAGVSTFVDITSRVQSERRAEFLAEIGGLVSQAESPGSVTQEVLNRFVARFGGIGVVAVAGLNEAEGFQSLAVASDSPENLAEFKKCLAEAPVRFSGADPVRVLATGQAEWIAEFSTDQLAQPLQGGGSAAFFERMKLRSYLCVPLIARGKVLGTFSVLRLDSISDEQDLAFAQEVGRRIALVIDNSKLLERALEGVRLRNEALAVVSHDVRSPLTSLQLLLNLILDHEVSSDQVKPTLQKALNQIARCTTLMDQLLDISRLDSGSLPMELEKCDFSAVVLSAAEDMRPLVEKSGCAFDLSVEPGVTALVEASRIYQVIGNLLSNAAKYGANTPLALSLKREGESHVLLSVRDGGIGISKEKIEKLFDRFTRGVDDGDFQGAGLGLHIARQIVELHGGKIWADSETGKGSIFYVRLPVA